MALMLGVLTIIVTADIIIIVVMVRVLRVIIIIIAINIITIALPILLLLQKNTQLVLHTILPNNLSTYSQFYPSTPRVVRVSIAFIAQVLCSDTICNDPGLLTT